MLSKKAAIDLSLVTRRDDEPYSDIADPDVRVKIKTEKPFLKKKLAVALAVKELKPEALSAIRDATDNPTIGGQDHQITSCNWCGKECYTLPCQGCGMRFCFVCTQSGSRIGRDCLCKKRQEKITDTGAASKKTRVNDVAEIPIPDQPMEGDGDLDFLELPADLSNRTLIECLELDESEAQKHRALAFDDAPHEIERATYQDEPVGAEQRLTIAMYPTAYSEGGTGNRSEWLDKRQMNGLGTLMKKIIKGVRVHSQPCCDVTTPYAYYHDKQSYDIAENLYQEIPIESVRMTLTHKELRNMTDGYQIGMNDVYELALKPNQNKLNS